MPPLSRGIKEQLQADRQQVRQSLLPQPRTWTWERVGDDRRRALVSCSGTACTFVGVKSDLQKKRAPFVCPKHMQSSRRNPTIHTPYYYLLKYLYLRSYLSQTKRKPSTVVTVCMYPRRIVDRIFDRILHKTFTLYCIFAVSSTVSSTVSSYLQDTAHGLECVDTNSTLT